MKKPHSLDYRALRPVLKAGTLAFKTTNDLKRLNHCIGQERALQALRFGLETKHQGYPLYAMGSSDLGKHELVREWVAAYAKQRPTPNDWCYIHNFDNPSKPTALALPPGIGHLLQQDMKTFVDEMSTSAQSIFESKQFRAEMKKIAHFSNKKFKLESNASSPSVKIKELSREKFLKEKRLRFKLIKAVISPPITVLKRKYKKYLPITKYLTATYKDILEHVDDLMHLDENTNALLFSPEQMTLAKYGVNLMVDNKDLKGAPVIFEPVPHYSNLICRIEYIQQQGNLVTHFTLIKPGALHLANGGYLIVDIRKMRKQPELWEIFKSTLYAQNIKIEPIERAVHTAKLISISPMPIPLQIKIILLGDRNTYYDLCQEDTDFTKLFKVIVDFDEDVDRNEKNIKLYAQLIGTLVKREKLLPFHADAVAAIIDFCSRLSEDIEKLSTHLRAIEDLIIESNYWAAMRHVKIVRASDVETAIHAKAYRTDRTRELYYEDIKRNFIIIHTRGESIGQVNCLSVRKVGYFSYGHPTRVTARIRKGKGRIIDIQREIKMAGPQHTKAGLIIANFLASRFSSDQLFSLSASLSFEQVYGYTDGDSASVGECCALLSAIANIPIRQSFAVTGSIDQYGEAQAVGGVNEKIEGFFDVCTMQGLTGHQGVLIPAVNRKNLMLKDSVVEAAKQKKFTIYLIDTIDDAMTLLTGLPVGKRQKNGEFTKDSLYYIIEKKLRGFAR